LQVKDVNVVCGLLKNFLSNLNDTLLPSELFLEVCELTEFIEDKSENKEHKIIKTKNFLVKKLKKTNFLILQLLFKFCEKVIQNVKTTKMGYNNIMILIGGYIIRNTSESKSNSNVLLFIQFLIENNNVLFKNFELLLEYDDILILKLNANKIINAHIQNFLNNITLI
jgi:hypothetical protein